MAKKLLCAIVLILALVCLFASCDNDDVANHTHDYGEWEIVKTATCTVDGVKERYCDCGEKQSVSIPAPNHTYGEWITVKKATSTEKGSAERVCSCGAKETKDIDALSVVTTVTESQWKSAFDFAKYSSITIVGSEAGSEDGIEFDFDATIKYYAGLLFVSIDGEDFDENDSLISYRETTLTKAETFPTLAFNQLQRLVNNFEELSDFGYSKITYSTANKAYQTTNDSGRIYTFWFENGVLVKYSFEDNGQAEYLRATYEFKNINSTERFSIPSDLIKTEYLEIVNSISPSAKIYCYDEDYNRTYCDVNSLKDILKSLKIDIIVHYEKGTLSNQINNYSIKTSTMSSLDKTLYLSFWDGKLQNIEIGDISYYVE